MIFSRRAFLGGLAASALASASYAGTPAPFTTLSPKVRKIVLMAAVGQSTANGLNNLRILTAKCPTPGHVLMWNGGIRVLGTEQDLIRRLDRIPEESLAFITDAHEQVFGKGGESQWTQAAYECQKRLGDEVAVVVATVAIGSAPYEWVGKNSRQYMNLLVLARRTAEAARHSGLGFEIVVCWPEQEGNQYDTQAEYLAKCVQFQKDLTADIRNVTGYRGQVRLFVDGWAGDTAYKIDTREQPLAQLQFALENPSVGFYSAPTYLFPTMPDGVHRTPEGAALDGAYFGRTVANALLSIDARPLYVTTAIAIGGHIQCRVNLPAGAKGLTDKSDLVTTPPANLGITCHEAVTDAPIEIEAVTITGRDTFSVIPKAMPRGKTIHIEMAFRGNEGARSGPTTGDRSPINDGNPDRSFYGVSMANHLAPQVIEMKIAA